MKAITEHRLTRGQVALIRNLLETYADSRDDVDQDVEDLLECTNAEIFGGEQEVLVRYVTGPKHLEEEREVLCPACNTMVKV